MRLESKKMDLKISLKAVQMIRVIIKVLNSTFEKALFRLVQISRTLRRYSGSTKTLRDPFVKWDWKKVIFGIVRLNLPQQWYFRYHWHWCRHLIRALYTMYSNSYDLFLSSQLTAAVILFSNLKHSVHQHVSLIL